MLETARAAKFEPGTNRRDDVAGAGWTFLLPDLGADRVLFIGAPSAASLATLARAASSVVVWCPDRRHRRRLRRAAVAAAWPNVRVEPALPDPSDPKAAQGFDLVCLPPGGARALVDAPPDILRQVPALLAPDGRAYLELAGTEDRLRGRALLDALADYGFGDARRLWLTPRRGEVRAAAPVSAPELRRYLVERGLHRPESPSGLIDHLGRIAGGAVARRHPSHRVGVLVGPSGEGGRPPVPRFVADIAAGAGIDLARHRVALSARGRFSSRKVVLFLFAEGGATPDLVVKMTRHPSLNPRLENEHRVLLRLSRDRIGAPGTRPEVAFFGHHRGLAVLAQPAVDGVPFGRRTTASPACPLARAAVSWLEDLAAATVAPHPTPASEVAASLGHLLEHYTRLYNPDSAERGFLAGQIDSLASSDLRTVFQHGDPGTWNLIVSGDRVVFLDWEAADAGGMPLWDLFHFFRSYAVLAARRAGVRDPLDGFAREILDDGPLSRFMATSVAASAGRLRLDPALAGPLLATGFMHRALKEATRLPTGGLGAGHYVRLLRRCISRWNDPWRESLCRPAHPDGVGRST